jgi:hypothetical protein
VGFETTKTLGNREGFGGAAWEANPERGLGSSRELCGQVCLEGVFLEFHSVGVPYACFGTLHMLSDAFLVGMICTCLSVLTCLVGEIVVGPTWLTYHKYRFGEVNFEPNTLE